MGGMVEAIGVILTRLEPWVRVPLDHPIIFTLVLLLVLVLLVNGKKISISPGDDKVAQALWAAGGLAVSLLLAKALGVIFEYLEEKSRQYVDYLYFSMDLFVRYPVMYSSILAFSLVFAIMCIAIFFRDSWRDINSYFIFSYVVFSLFLSSSIVYLYDRMTTGSPPSVSEAKEPV